MLSDAAAEAVGDWRRATRILSIGTAYVWEELVNLITIRMGVALVRSVLEVSGVDASSIDIAQFEKIASASQAL